MDTSRPRYLHMFLVFVKIVPVHDRRRAGNDTADT